MKKRSYRMFVEDLLEAMDKIGRYTQDLSYETFAKHEMIVDAVIRNLEIIGEASRNIPEDVREKYSDIPWKRMNEAVPQKSQFVTAKKYSHKQTKQKTQSTRTYR